MTLIIGVNCHDRIHLAGDTRLSRKLEGGRFKRVSDRIQKVVVLNDNVVLAVAGTLALAQEVSREIIRRHQEMNGIAKESELIDIAKKAQNSYYSRPNVPYTNAAFLFAYRDLSRKKSINANVLKSVTYKTRQRHGFCSLPKELERHTRASSSGHQDLDVNYTGLKGMVLKDQREPCFSNAEWGQVLAYGERGFSKDDVHNELFEGMELTSQKGHPLYSSAMMVHTVRTYASAKNLGTVGNIIVSLVVHQSLGSILPTGEVMMMEFEKDELKNHTDLRVVQGELRGYPGKKEPKVLKNLDVIDGQLHGYINERPYKLIPFHDWKLQKNESAQLVI